MGKKFILLCFFILLVIIPSANAQEIISLQTMTIDLWPEYDQPNMLVIYKAELSPDVSLPAEITFSIPVQAGEPAVVAVGPDASSVTETVYETRVMNDWLEVSFIATTPAIQFEYYDPSLMKNDAQRNFDFTWPGDYGVNSLVLQVQHPLEATDFTITPASGRVVTDTIGFIYNIIEVGALDQGSTFNISLGYQKDSDALSIENFQIQPSATITPGSSNLFNLDQWWIWLLIVFGVVLIGGGSYWYWRLGRQETPAKKRRHRKTDEQELADATPGKNVYCHQCGKRAGPGDRFCRACGTRLRIG